jgi:hypothetical protein
MSRLFGGALGLAVLSTVATSQTHASASAGTLQALTDGFGTAFRFGASFTIAAAVVALIGLRPSRQLQMVRPAEVDEPASEEALAA